jgi:hypothetical protein
MKIEITEHHTGQGTAFFYWEMHDGPEDIDEVKGFATDLIEVFSKIVEWREKIASDYTDFENETNC